MKKILALALLTLPLQAHAEAIGPQGLAKVKQCIMQNNTALCHAVLTQNSYALFDKFANYQLLPCLPTDFEYVDEKSAGAGETIVKASLPKDSGHDYYFKMVFVNGNGGAKVDLPQTLQMGLGPDWKKKMDMSEQLFLMLSQNTQNKQLTCQVLQNMAEPHKGNL
ncbi:MAG TPA: hypothetical protein VFT64_08705 [Rickettsiales bacterium]|nr:hypothetical protein [Rickettsiales bacterium]